MADLQLDQLLAALGLNLVAVTLLVVGVFFRRHRRRDLVLGYYSYNVSLFCVSAALGSAGPLNLGVGFGIFAVLSIVRLRSEEATQAEIGYTMVALVLGLLNGLPGLDLEVKALFSVLLVGTMTVVDHPGLLPVDRHQRFRVDLDVVLTEPGELRDELESRLGGRVHQVIVQEVDYVRETMRVDVRIQEPGR